MSTDRVQTDGCGSKAAQGGVESGSGLLNLQLFSYRQCRRPSQPTYNCSQSTGRWLRPTVDVLRVELPWVLAVGRVLGQELGGEPDGSGMEDDDGQVLLHRPEPAVQLAVWRHVGRAEAAVEGVQAQQPHYLPPFGDLARAVQRLMQQGATRGSGSEWPGHSKKPPSLA